MPRRRALGPLWLLLAIFAPAAVRSARAPQAYSLITDVLRKAELGGQPEAIDESLEMYTKQEKEENKKESSAQERAENSQGFLITCMLIGGIVFDMTILYLLNSSDPQVRSYSYKMLSTGIIVFCALLVQNFQEKVTYEFIDWVTADHVELLAMILHALPFCFWLFSISWWSWKLSDNPEDQYCTLNLVGHISAFTALEYIGHAQEHAAVHWIHTHEHHSHGRICFGSVLNLYLFLPFIVWLGYRGCMQVADVTRKRYLECPRDSASGRRADASDHTALEDDHGPLTDNRSSPAASSGEVVDEGPAVHEEEEEEEENDHGHGHGHGHHNWKMEAVHAEADSLAIVVGFLIKQCCAYLVTARPVPLDCAKYPVKCHVESSQIWLMMFLALGFYIALIPTWALHARSRRHRKVLIRVTLILGMSLSWILVQVSEWLTIDIIEDTATLDSPLQSKTVKKLICAAVLSPLFVLVILHVDALADWGIINSVSAEATMQCIAFLIGFYWEKVLMSAIKNFSTHTQGDRGGVGTLIMRAVVGLGLLGAIMPAWRWFLVPVACKPVPEREAGQSSVTGVLLQSVRDGKEQAAMLVGGAEAKEEKDRRDDREESAST